MALPQNNTDEKYRNKKLPSGMEVGLRPWKVKDKKAFLIDTEGNNDPKVLRESLINLVKDCAEDREIIDRLPENDLMSTALELRKMSEGTTVDYKVICPHCKIPQDDLVIDLQKDVKIKKFDTSPLDIGKRKFFFKEMPAKDKTFIDEEYGNNKAKFNFEYLARSISQVMEGDSVFANFTLEEMKTWLDEMTYPDLEALGKGLQERMSSFTVNNDVDCVACGKKIKVYFEDPGSFFVS